MDVVCNTLKYMILSSFHISSLLQFQLSHLAPLPRTPTTPCILPQHCSNLSPPHQPELMLYGSFCTGFRANDAVCTECQHTGQSLVGMKHRRGGVQAQSLAVEGPRFGQISREESMVALVLQLLSLLYCLCIHWPAAKASICLGILTLGEAY